MSEVKKKKERPLNIKIDGFSEEELKGITIPTKMGATELDWKIPSFCPRCEEIRGHPGGGSIIASVTQALAWKSFGMCETCYLFQRDYPEDTEKNKVAYAQKKAEKEVKKIATMAAHRYRVFIYEKNDKFPSASFASTVVDYKFTRWPSETSRGLANKTIQLLTEETSKEIVEILQSKGLTCWYDDSEYRAFFDEYRAYDVSAMS